MSPSSAWRPGEWLPRAVHGLFLPRHGVLRPRGAGEGARHGLPGGRAEGAVCQVEFIVQTCDSFTITFSNVSYNYNSVKITLIDIVYCLYL